MPTNLGPFLARVHYYDSPTKFSCAYETGAEGAPNAVLAIGGLGDGPHTVPVFRRVASRLDPINGGPNYSVFEIRMKSSFNAFGTSSLAEDVEHIAGLVKYLRGIGKEKIVLLGHSTGSQDIAEYVCGGMQAKVPVDGFILQGPASDREAIDCLSIESKDEKLRDCLAALEVEIAEGRKDEILPGPKVFTSFAGTPFTAYRLHSLLAKGGDDDYFSSDLDDEFVAKVWSKFDKPVLALHSAEDEYVPSRVDKQKLVNRWRKACPQMSPLSGLIPGANHTVDAEESQRWFSDTIAEFLKAI